MKSMVSSKYMKSKASRVALALSILISVTSCGSSEDRTADASSIAPYNGWTQTYGGSPTQNGNPLGVYSGNLVQYNYTADGQRWETQAPYQLNLTTSPMEGQDPSRVYARMSLFTQGAINARIDGVYLDTLANGAPSGNSLLYRFRSVPTVISGLSNQTVAVEMQIALQNGIFNPAQSWIRILDCGFSKTNCSSLYSGAQTVGFTKL